MYNNFKVVFLILIFTYNRAIEHSIQKLLEFEMSIFQLFSAVHGCNFQQLSISFSVFKQQIINYVQQF